MDARRSPLYQRFNGIMFGFFAQLASFRAARQQWPALQAQMSGFADEIGLDVRIPETVEAFAEMRNEIFHAVLGLDDSLDKLKLAFGLGYAYVGLALRAEVMDRASFDDGLSALGLDPHAVDEGLVRITRDETGRPDFDDIMGEGLQLTTSLIETCDPEEDTCFVAMPFQPPFPNRFHGVYRPWLAPHGLQVVRAWGGMRNELHREMLLTLIDHCGWMLAELTQENPNVTYELGYATGRNKRWLAIMDTNPVSWEHGSKPQEPIKLSNLRGQGVFPYDSSEADWREDLISGMGWKYVDIAKKIYAGETPPGQPDQPPRHSWIRELGRRLLAKDQ